MPATSQHIEEQAAEWLLSLHEGAATEAQRQAYERWQQQSPQHAAAAARMEDMIARMHALRSQPAPAKAALNAAFQGRTDRLRKRRALRALLLAGCLALPALALQQSRYPQLWMADTRTAPGEWKTLHLQDHSTLTLNGASAINLHFDGTQRRVELLQGEILVDVAHDQQRALVVQTAEGTLRALGTRFVVQREDGITRLTMLQSRVAAQSANARQTLEVAAGAAAVITRHGVELAGVVDPRSIDDAWHKHQLVVDDQPLGDVLEALARQRRGHVQFDRGALADLRVSAVLPLDDSDRALQLLGEILPIQVRQFTPWLVVVSAAKNPEK